MALTYGFYNSNNGDRRYTAEQMSAIFNYLITEGVLSSYGNHFAVIPGVGMQVLVKSGWAWYESTWTQNDADMPLSLSPSDPVSGRIDAIVLETNHNISSRANRIKVVEGTYSSFPQKPALTSSANVNEHALAYVKVNAGATNITTIDIEIVVGKEETPFITSVLQSTSIDVLFNQWEGEFDAWFEHIQEVLSEEVVTNLYAEIDKRVKIADKASEAEAKAGTNDTHWMTPAKVRVAAQEVMNKFEVNGYPMFYLCHGPIREALISIANDFITTVNMTGGLYNQLANSRYLIHDLTSSETDSLTFRICDTLTNTSSNIFSFSYTLKYRVPYPDIYIPGKKDFFILGYDNGNSLKGAILLKINNISSIRDTRIISSYFGHPNVLFSDDESRIYGIICTQYISSSGTYVFTINEYDSSLTYIKNYPGISLSYNGNRYGSLYGFSSQIDRSGGFPIFFVYDYNANQSSTTKYRITYHNPITNVSSNIVEGTQIGMRYTWSAGYWDNYWHIIIGLKPIDQNVNNRLSKGFYYRYAPGASSATLVRTYEFGTTDINSNPSAITICISGKFFYQYVNNNLWILDPNKTSITKINFYSDSIRFFQSVRGLHSFDYKKGEIKTYKGSNITNFYVENIPSASSGTLSIHDDKLISILSMNTSGSSIAKYIYYPAFIDIS